MSRQVADYLQYLREKWGGLKDADTVMRVLLMLLHEYRRRHPEEYLIIRDTFLKNMPKRWKGR